MPHLPTDAKRSDDRGTDHDDLYYPAGPTAAKSIETRVPARSRPNQQARRISADEPVLPW